MALYKYYQLAGGTEPWTPIQASQDLDSLKPTFVTILMLDTLLDDNPTRDQIDATKYLGPAYFDLDDADLSNSINDARELANNLVTAGLEPEDLDIFLSGKKGLHITVPPTCFMERAVPVVKLPAIYKELAFKFAVGTLDLRVYTARRGRMLRTAYNVRENGAYKVPITFAELQTLDVESYQNLCKAPRQVPASTGQFRAKFSIVYETIKQKILAQKRKKLKTVSLAELKQHEPFVKRVMNGETNSSAGFNNIALQLALYARECKLSADELVQACQGLIKNHQSDGFRYNSPRKREAEIRRMFFYVEDNAAYDYAIEPIKALIKPTVNPDAEGYEEAGDSEVSSGGVYLSGGCYYAASAGEGNDKLILAASFTDSEPLLDPKTQLISCLRVALTIPGKPPIRLGIERGDFTNSAALHRAISPTGVSFLGSDTHARSIYELMLRKMGNKYVIEAEGISYINIPKSEHEIAREPFLVWADSNGVRLPKSISDLGIEFEFQGYPTAEGALRTDLTNAPPLASWIMEEGNKERLRDALVNLFGCHQPEPLSKIVGWMVACFWRQLFHAGYNQFPLLHVNGAAGAGKSHLVGSLLSLFYYKQTPMEMTPGSTHFAFAQTVCGSASIPIMLDEYKPSAMAPGVHDKYKLLLRDAYNMRSINKGGGNRAKDSFSAINSVTLSGPIVFVAEAIDTETALLERTVLATIKKPSNMKAYKTFQMYQAFRNNRDVLSVIGHNIAAHVAKTATLEDFQAEFDVIYTKARERFMPKPGDELVLSEAEMQAKATVHERSIFNISVADFGLTKLESLLKAIFGAEFDEPFAETFTTLHSRIYSQMEDLAKNTMAEYLKVLCVMSDQTRLADGLQYKLVSGEDYVITEEGGFPILVLAPRSCYAKYRAWSRYMGLTPLFTGDTAFSHSLKDAPMFMRYGYGTKALVVDTLIFDYNALLRAGVPPLAGKPMNLQL